MSTKTIDQLTPARLRSILSNELPGENAHIDMLPKGRGLTPGNKDKITESAVLILLFKEEEEIKICLTRRPSTLRHHAGQISFPGGKKERHETNATETALREANEETGINTAHVEIIGALSPIYVEVSCFLIEPVVGWMEETPRFSVNNSEVDELIILPLSAFLKEGARSVANVETPRGKIEAPCFLISGYTIWGATAMMLAELSMLLKAHLNETFRT